MIYVFYDIFELGVCELLGSPPPKAGNVLQEVCVRVCECVCVGRGWDVSGLGS